MQKLSFLILLLLCLLSQSCTVSFINAGIDYSVLKSFSIEQFDVKAANAPPESGQNFSEKLKDKVLTNTRLAFSNENGDIQFTGYVSAYQVKSLAPQGDQTVAFQQLNITVNVQYTDQKSETDNNWQQSFSRFANFSSDQDLSTVEEALIEEIYDQILNDVFNKAFSGW